MPFEWIKTQAKEFQRKFEAGHQLTIIDDVLDKFWGWNLRGYGGEELGDVKRVYLKNIMNYLPPECTHLDVGLKDVLVRRQVPEDQKVVWGFKELEENAKRLTSEIKRPRIVHYEMSEEGELMKITRNMLNNKEYKITLRGLVPYP